MNTPKYILRLLALFLILPTILYSQVSNILPSQSAANAKSLGANAAKYNVNHINGALSFSVPLLTASSNNVTVPIGLNYVAGSGVPVNMLSSEVGLGWNLYKGAYISREVRGLPDDVYCIRYTSTGDDPVFYNAGYLYRDIELLYNEHVTEIPQGLKEDIEQGGKDTEPDIFHFNVGGVTGSFVFKDGQVKHLSQTDIKIEYELDREFKYDEYYSIQDEKIYFGSTGGIISFKITLPSGLTHTLSTKTISITNTNNESTSHIQSPCHFNAIYNGFTECCAGAYFRTFKEGSIVSINTWHVSSIGSLIDAEEIKFEYDKEVIYDHSTIFQKHSDAVFFDQNYITGDQECHAMEDGFTNSLRHLSLGWRLTKIRFRKGLQFDSDGWFEFEYDDEQRSDLYYDNDEEKIPWISNEMKGKKLNKIVWKKNGSDFRTVTLLNEFKAGGYVGQGACPSGDDFPQPWWLRPWASAHDYRLQLYGVNFSGHDGSSLPDFTFDYEDDHALPPRHLLATDFWGYYNGMDLAHLEDFASVPIIYWYPDDAANNALYKACFSIYPRPSFAGEEIVLAGVDKNPNIEYVRTNMLSSVTYPNGAMLEFTYELNQADFMGTEKPSGGLRIASLQAPEEALKTYTYEDNGTTSGVFIDIPVFASYVSYILESFDDTPEMPCINYISEGNTSANVISFSYAQNELDGKGLNAMYTKVTETVQDYGYTEYHFNPHVTHTTASYDCTAGTCIYEPMLIETEGTISLEEAHCSFGLPGNPNYNWRRAAPTKIMTYNLDGQLARKVINTYDVFGAEKIKAIRYISPFIADVSRFRQYNIFGAAKYYVISGDQRITSSSVTDYVLGSEMETVTNFEYSTKHIYPIKTWFINSDGKEIATERKYLADIAPDIGFPLDIEEYCENLHIQCEQDCYYEVPPSPSCFDDCQTELDDCLSVNDDYYDAYDALDPNETLLHDLHRDGMGGMLMEETKRIGGVVTNGSKVEYARDYEHCETCILPKRIFSFENDWLEIKNTPDYNTYGRPLAIETLDDHNTLYTYFDTTGLLDNINYDNRQTSYTYNNFNELQSVIPFDGLTEVFSFDGLGRLKNQSERNGNIMQSYTYSTGPSNNSVLKETTLSDATAPDVLVKYDQAGRAVSSTFDAYTYHGNDWTESTAYDALGRATVQCDPAAGGCTTIEHEEEKLLSRITKTTAPGWSKFNEIQQSSGWIDEYLSSPGQYEVDESFHLSIIYDENGNRMHRYTDKIGRVFKIIRFDGPSEFTTDYEYDTRGRIKKVKQPGGTSFEYQYEWENGWKITTTIPGGGARITKTDLKGNLVLEQDANGNIFEHFYDGYNQLIKTEKNGEIIKAYSFDSKGRLDSESLAILSDGNTNEEVVRDYVYDDSDFNRLDFVEETVFGITMKTDFNGYDHRDINTSIITTYSGNVAQTYNHGLSYDHGARLTDVVINTKPIVNIEYTDNDWVKKRNLGSDLESITYGYNSRGWLTRINKINECYEDDDTIDPNLGVSDGTLQKDGSLTIYFNAGQLLNGPGSVISLHYQMSYTNDTGLVYAINQINPITVGNPTGPTTFTDSVTFNMNLEPTGGGLGGTGATNIVLTTIGFGPLGFYWLDPLDRDQFVIRIDDFFDNYITSDQDCQEGNGLFAEEIHYDFGSSIVDADAQYNGNVSYIRWSALDRPVINIYGMQYDGIDRMTQAKYIDKRVWTPSGQSTYVNEDAYSVYVNAYDQNGNIQDIQRNGFTSQVNSIEINHAEIDQIGMNYTNNRLTSVTESSNAELGYQGVGQATIAYDDNGNRLTETEHGATITYNYLDLPETIVSNGKTISIMYDANGNKRKMIVDWGVERREVIYMGSAEIIDSKIKSYYHADGRLYIDDDDKEQHEYVISDHLGNSRVFFSDLDDDGSISLDPQDEEVTQEAHYYPFGMKMDGSWIQAQSPQDKYHFNGIEFPVNELHMGFTRYRTCDVGLGSWYQVDPRAEAVASMSPYNSMNDSPMSVIDPMGDIGIAAPGFLLFMNAYATSATAFAVTASSVSMATITAMKAGGGSQLGTLGASVGTSAALSYTPLLHAPNPGLVMQSYITRENKLIQEINIPPDGTNDVVYMTDMLRWHTTKTGYYIKSTVVSKFNSFATLAALGGPSGLVMEGLYFVGGSLAFTAVIKASRYGYLAYKAQKAAKAGTQGGLNLFKWGKPSTSTAKGWRTGDYMLHLPNKGTPKLNWKANYGALRREMRYGKPIFDSYLKPNGTLRATDGFLNAERYILKSRGWTFNKSIGAWVPPGF